MRNTTQHTLSRAGYAHLMLGFGQVDNPELTPAFMQDQAISAMMIVDTLRLAALQCSDGIRQGDSARILEALHSIDKSQVAIPTEIHTIFSFCMGAIARDIAKENYKATNPAIMKTYLVQSSATNLCKIGRTTRPAISDRVTQFSSHTGGLVKVLGHTLRDIEGELHKEYKSKRRVGEWFELDAEDIKSILEKFNQT